MMIIRRAKPNETDLKSNIGLSIISKLPDSSKLEPKKVVATKRPVKRTPKVRAEPIRVKNTKAFCANRR